MSITRNPGLNIDKNGGKRWYNNKQQYHNENGPAYVVEGSQQWFINGELHRIDGPAVIWDDGNQSWFLNSICYYDNKSYQKAANISDEDMAMIVLKYGNVE